MRTIEMEMKVLRFGLARLGQYGVSNAAKFAERFVRVKREHAGAHGWIVVQWGARRDLIVYWQPRYREEEYPEPLLEYAPYSREDTNGEDLGAMDARGVASCLCRALGSSGVVWVTCEPVEPDGEDKIAAIRWLAVPRARMPARRRVAAVPTPGEQKALVLRAVPAGDRVYEVGEVIPWQGPNMADLCAQSWVRRLTPEETRATVACDCGCEFLSPLRLREHAARAHRDRRTNGSGEKPADRS